MTTQQDKSVSPALIQNEILSALLEATGNLDSAEALQKSLPDMLLKSSAATLVALDQTARDLHTIQLKVDKDLLRLKPLNTFCKTELTRALNLKWSAVFDVENDLLSMPGPDCGCPPTSTDSNDVETVPHAIQTLLQGAMQNFSEDEEADSFPVGSLVRVASAPSGVAGLTPASFAGFCRELDLGKRYQEHLQEVFGLKDSAGEVVATSPMTRDIATMKKYLLQLDMHLAGLRQHITPAGLQTLQNLIAADGRVLANTLQYRKRPLIMHGIEILDSCIWGVVVFSVRSVELYPDEWCLVYMANEPARPLYEYTSFNAFKQYLTQQLKVKSYKDYFANSIDEDDKADFFKAFADTADLGHIRQLPITVPLFEFMVQSHVGKMQIDARKLAVPTTDIDESVRQKRLLNFLELGVTIATVAGFFVPVVGQLMMGVAAGQLLAEVYEGVEDWRRGDRQEALSHLFAVAENIALMGAFAAGQKVVGTLGRKLIRAHPEFFGQFAAVTNAAGKPRLWKPDLTAYEHRLPVGFTVAYDSEEMYDISDSIVGRVDSRIVSGTVDQQTGRWRLDHPRRSQAYTPELERHVEGGWRLPAEDPEQWNSVPYTLKRIDPNLSEFADNDLDMIRRISDVTYDELHRNFTDNLALPVRLRDTVERLRVERQLRLLIRELGEGETHSGQPLPEQLHGLPKLAGWPTDRYIEVSDYDADVTTRYPATNLPDDTLSVVVSQEQLDSGQLLQAVIDGLYSEEVDALLGTRVNAGGARQALARKLGAALKADRRSVFERMYQRYDQSDAEEVKNLRNVFADIPVRYAQRLIDQAPSVERMHLRSTGRVPLRLAQKARNATIDVRLDRALCGLHVPQVANADSEKLAIQLLPRLSGWDAGLRLAVRDKTLTGPVLEAIGSESATALNTCTLVKSSDGYEAFAGDGKSLGRIAAGPDSLYAAILKALSPRRRIAAGFPDPVDADSARLRKQLLGVALDEREASARLLTEGKLEPLVAEPVCIQADHATTATTHPRALIRKVRKLYPRFSEAQAREFIDGLGADALTRATRVKGLIHEREQLREILDVWSEDQAAMKALGGDLREVRQSRKSTAEQIEDGFRRIFTAKDKSGKSVCALNLDGMRVGKLPTLPPGLNFDHIKHLSLKNMEQDDDLVYFLKSFKQVESLELDDNTLTRLPEVFSHMPNLTFLGLAGNKIKLTEHALVKLANLRTLHTLNLNENPLGATPDVSKMFDLRALCLRETGATELPKGLAHLPSLDWVDLRNNEIRNLPDWLFKTTKRFSQAINLRHNPLSLASSAHLADYRNNVGIGMGYLEDDIARLDEQQARSLWFKDGAGEDWGRRDRIWTAFKDDPRAEGLFHLLAEVGNTADSEKVSDDMHRRVWAVLEAAESDAELCEQVLNLAANPINCTDTAAMNFSHIEVAVEVDRVTSLAGGRTTSAQPLLQLGRGLFRLDKLNHIAQEHVRKNPTADPLEVNLAYRTGLADELDLPGQPRHMRFAVLGGVTEADLATAKNAVNAAELSSEWLSFMLRQPFWCDYLKRTFPLSFTSIEETFAPQMDAVFDQATKLTTGDYLNQMDAIKLKREEAEETVVTRLTDDAIRLMDLGICAMPGD
ncbi:NEL-type E3 ubiquitin ligase domain-containing protein [Pseudomonas sp. FP2196]|uniref:NEL-type E3 ubiquitin ligase domain-containing protein n=1 Tax=Pseudomonas sp. FP2196 TaxID=2954086 RepID=UPI0027367C33|nr:NEL-type E3 ubiquitin ligase domain-containing protein [Pseudomonas sp. FP2196]WLH34109.1 NEL-type E3 ubiquitin ligase domain-containing protein [Pseudomonas sp. FP2196]